MQRVDSCLLEQVEFCFNADFDRVGANRLDDLLDFLDRRRFERVKGALVGDRGEGIALNAIMPSRS